MRDRRVHDVDGRGIVVYLTRTTAITDAAMQSWAKRHPVACRSIVFGVFVTLAYLFIAAWLQ